MGGAQGGAWAVGVVRAVSLGVGWGRGGGCGGGGAAAAAAISPPQRMQGGLPRSGKSKAGGPCGLTGGTRQTAPLLTVPALSPLACSVVDPVALQTTHCIELGENEAALR